MKVYIFIDWFDPAFKAGGPVQSIVNLVKYPLAGVEYFVVCSNKDLGGEVLPAVETDRWIRYNAHTNVWYASSNRRIPGLLRQLSAGRESLYFINGIYSPFFNLLPILIGKAGKRVVSARGMLHPGALSEKAGKKRLYLRLWKLLGLHRRVFFHATNHEEAGFIKAAFGNACKIYVAPNLPRTIERLVRVDKKVGNLRLVSIGIVSPMKNYLEVLKALAGCAADVYYTIYGPVKDEEYWVQCQRQIERLPANIRVDYRGHLPSTDVARALSEADLFVLPSKSENYGHALVEALSAGVPVLTSHATPWNQLHENRAGRNVMPENGYELSEAICFFAGLDAEEWQQWSAGAKAYAERRIDVNAISQRYLDMYRLTPAH